MTIVAGAVCPGGIAIAGDSRTTLRLPTGWWRAATDYAQKVYALDGKHVVATFGWALLEGQTISGILRNFDDQTTVDEDVHQAAVQLRDLFQRRINAHISAGIDPAPPPGKEPIGFLLAGYDGAGVGHLMRVWPYGGAIEDLFQTTAPGGLWGGETEVISRIYAGYDNHRIDISKWAARNQKALSNVAYESNFIWFALQDAIDWTMYVARTTIDTQRFTNGTVGEPGSIQTCGGEVEVATVTWPEGVRWIKRTDLTA